MHMEKVKFILVQRPQLGNDPVEILKILMSTDKWQRGTGMENKPQKSNLDSLRLRN